MKILAFAASNNVNSINQKLTRYAASLIEQADIEMLSIDDYEMPLFSDTREKELGSPALAQQFHQKIGEADAIIISFAEHNGTYTAAYKNLFDWASRIKGKVFQNKPMILLSTSPGAGGAANVLKTAVESAPYFGADVKGSLSIPSFFENFDIQTNQLTNEDLKAELLVISNLISG